MSVAELAHQAEATQRTRSAEDAARQQPEHVFGYNVLGKLGTGAGSTVYEVREPNTGRTFALKHVVVNAPRDLRFVEQLEREHEVGQSVRQQNLRQPLSLHVKRSLLRRITEAALVMEFVDGWPISVPTRPAAQVLGYLVQLAHTLEAFHTAGFVHCDLKPHNLLVDRDLNVKLIDLGQACRIGTVKERVQGTPDFISPEQVLRRAVTSKTDVYNFGATAYCILTGSKIPTLFTVKKGGDNSFLIDDRIPAPHELDEQIPQLLSALVMDCIALTPDERPEMPQVIRKLDAIVYMLSRTDPSRAVR